MTSTAKNAKTVAKSKLEEEALEIDLNHLTISEIETIEDIIDAPIDSLQHASTRKGKVLRAIAFVVGKREDDDYTMEQAGNRRVAFVDEKVPPTDGATSSK